MSDEPVRGYEPHQFVGVASDDECQVCGLLQFDEIHWLSRRQDSEGGLSPDTEDRCPSCGATSGICGPPDSTHCDDRWHGGGMQQPEPEDIHDSPLRRWWTDQSFDEADRTIAKMEEYGSLDLVHIGHGIWDMTGRSTVLTDAHAMELGCLFYVYGKIQRAMSAVKADRPILDDTWFDMHIYAKMAQAARAGVWPLS